MPRSFAINQHNRLITMDHKKLANRAENVSMATGVAAGIAAAGATIAAPTGLAAVGVWLGIVSPPLIVTAAPILAAVATVSGTISGAAYFYAKWKQHQLDANQLPAQESQSEDVGPQ